MCERYSLTADLDEVRSHFQVEDVFFPYKKRYNVSPTQEVPVVYLQGGERRLEEFRWGLIPFWAHDAVNTNCETMEEKRGLRRLFRKKRCVVPCCGFYVWKRMEKENWPIRVVPQKGGLFGLAGLYDVWKDRSGKEIRTFTIVTTLANRLLEPFQERMPAILESSRFGDWLDPFNQNADRLQSLLKVCDESNMHAFPVSPRVNRLTREAPDCIEEVGWQFGLVKE